MNKILNYLGIAKRAGYFISGTDAVIAGLSKKVKLVILASDASSATKDKIIKKCYYYHVKIVEQFTTEEIASAIGQVNPKVIAITDKGIAKQIILLLNEQSKLSIKNNLEERGGLE